MDARLAAKLISQAEYLVALTGAGISTPSGIPDFRSGDIGLWTRHDPMKVASLSTFRTQPLDFFNWFHPLATQIHFAEPNPAHVVLAKLEQQNKMKSLITQNIDGLHRKAGSRSIIEVHGTLDSLTCGSCYQVYPSNGFLNAYIEDRSIPICPNCGYVLKPDVILFEEQLNRETWQSAEAEAKKCDLMVIVGSSLEVSPVAQLPYTAISNGAKLILINQQPTYIDDRVSVRFYQDAAEVLPEILQAVEHV